MAFWRRNDVEQTLTRRNVAQLFRIFLAEYPECTQTQLALLTQHDRSDISNWVRGTRQGRVYDIEVLTRIADGLQTPDQARLLLGLAPAGAFPAHADPGVSRPRAAAQDDQHDDHAVTGPVPVHVAICGSRAPDTDASVIDAVVPCLARLVMSRGYRVSHGPVGVDIEVMTYIADQYRPPDFALAIGLFGHRNVIADAQLVIIIGGGVGTQAEIDLAASMGTPIMALPCSGGTARRFYQQAARDQRLRGPLSDEQFAALNACADPGEDFVRIVEDLISNDLGASSA